METALTFITGGARSGKSTFAEQTAARLALNEGGKLHYIATSKPSDEEMRLRIRRHKEQRKKEAFHGERGNVTIVWGPSLLILVRRILCCWIV